MNFISNLLLGTPTETDKEVARPKGSDSQAAVAEAAHEALIPTGTANTPTAAKQQPQEEEEEEEEEAEVMKQKQPPPLPRASFVRGGIGSRARSLSRVYNQVPRGRPDFRTAQLDMIEYYAHLAMIETDADRVKEEDRNLRDALRGCKFRNYGRLYSRLQIASLCISIGAHQTDPENLVAKDDDDVEQDGAPPDFKPATFWNGLREQLIIVKSFMLRKDANALVPVVRPGYDDQDEDDDIPVEDDELDGSLEKHEMFQESYEEVLQLMQVQEVLSSFCGQIISIDSNPDALKQLESAINSYESALQKMFVPEGTIGGKVTESYIPEVLNKFLLADISQQPSDAAASLLRDAFAVMRNEACVYSHVQLKGKMKAVLTKWCESILDSPKLVQLGYGGVMAPIVTGFEDDVSSYGVEEDRLLTQKPDGDMAAESGGDEMDVEPEPIPLRPSKRDGRRTSFADEVLASRDRIPPRLFPSKSPRMRKPDDRKPSKKSPPRKSSRGTARTSSRRQEDDEDDEEDDNGSNTQDPTATINQHGGATPEDRASTPPRRARDKQQHGISLANGARSKKNAKSPNNRKRKVKPLPGEIVDELWEDPVEPSPKRRTYMDWTEDETEAVKEGYEKFGKRWAMIKHNCQHRLSRRTNVQIKDKWRTMVNAGEIEEYPV